MTFLKRVSEKKVLYIGGCETDINLDVDSPVKKCECSISKWQKNHLSADIFDTESLQYVVRIQVVQYTKCNI